MRKYLPVFVLVFGLLLVAALEVVSLARRSRLLAKLSDPSPAVRLAAIRSLDRDADVDLLVAALTDDDADVRLITAERLGGEGANTRKRADALITALRDQHAGVRKEARSSLWSLVPESVAPLIVALRDPDSRVRRRAAAALNAAVTKSGQKQFTASEVETIVPLLRRLLDDEQEEVRKCAADSLRSFRSVRHFP